MIEFLNARRMIFVIGILIFLCILILILEDTITDNVDKPTPNRAHQNNSLNPKQPAASLTDHLESPLRPSIKVPDSVACWERESFTLKSKCAPCSSKERLIPACRATGYKEQVHCDISGDILRSCDSVSSFFWVFQFFMVCLSAVFNFYVKKRQSYLNRLVLERIEKQISCGV